MTALHAEHDLEALEHELVAEWQRIGERHPELRSVSFRAISDLFGAAVRVLRPDLRDDVRLAGTAEAAEILGVSSQRVSRLRLRKGFPEPVAVLRSGPVWLREQVEVFGATWDRDNKGGRPRKAAASSPEVE